MMEENNNNLLGDYDQSRVSVQESGYRSNYLHVWYDITDIVKNAIGDKTPSTLEYVIKIEAKICNLYDSDEDYLEYTKGGYVELFALEYRFLSCDKGDRRVYVSNDGKEIRLTFANGSEMVVSNSESGSIVFG